MAHRRGQHMRHVVHGRASDDDARIVGELARSLGRGFGWYLGMLVGVSVFCLIALGASQVFAAPILAVLAIVIGVTGYWVYRRRTRTEFDPQVGMSDLATWIALALVGVAMIVGVGYCMSHTCGDDFAPGGGTSTSAACQ